MASETEERRERPEGAAKLVEAAVRHTYRTDASFFAASLSYYALTALMPTLLLAFLVVASVVETAFARHLVLTVGDVLTERGQTFVVETLRDVVDRPGIAIFAAAVAVASAVQLFRTLNRAFEFIYESGRASPALSVRESGMVLAVGLLGMFTVLLAAAAMALYANEELRLVATPLVVFVATGLALFPLFYSLPEPAVTVHEVLPGTVFTAFSWTVIGAALGLYAANTDGVALYGLLGGLLLVITWLYAAHVTLLFGAALNAVLAGRVATSVDHE